MKKHYIKYSRFDRFTLASTAASCELTRLDGAIGPMQSLPVFGLPASGLASV